MVKLAAIVNLTPDSFSDGGKFADAAAALDTIRGYITDGAAVIDIGAESTRHGATPVSPEEEWRRLEPVLSGLQRVKKTGVEISVDTRHGETAAKALALGADWINDVTGFSSPGMAAAVRNSDCTLVMMHSLGAPADKNVTLPEDGDVVETLLAWAKERIALLEKQGIAKNRIVFDPGLGFGKTAAQSHAIVRDISRFKALELPVLAGHSRKSFLNIPLPLREGVGGGEFSPTTFPPPQPSPSRGEGNKARDEATLAMSQYLAEQGVDYLRVHDVTTHARVLYREKKYG